MLDGQTALLLTIVAAFSQSLFLGITLFVFYRNLKEIKVYNKMTEKRFVVQSRIEKFTLTLKFADWIKTELSDYALFLTSDVKNVHLSKEEIQTHFISIAQNTIKLIKDETIFRSLMVDELKKLHSVIGSFSKDDKLLSDLKKLLHSDDL